MADGPAEDSAAALARLAGGSVTEHVAALLNEAELTGETIVSEAAAEAEQARERGAARAAELHEEALKAASEVLMRVSSIEDRLGVVVAELREEALRLPGAPALLADSPAREAPAPSAIPAIGLDVEQLAANLRSILDGPPKEASQPDHGGESGENG